MDVPYLVWGWSSQWPNGGMGFRQRVISAGFTSPFFLFMRNSSWHWIGKRENLQETMAFTIKRRVSCKFSLKPIQWSWHGTLMWYDSCYLTPLMWQNRTSVAWAVPNTEQWLHSRELQAVLKASSTIRCAMLCPMALVSFQTSRICW